MINKIKSRMYNIYAIADLLEEQGSELHAEQLRADVNSALINLAKLENSLNELIIKFKPKTTKKLSLKDKIKRHFKHNKKRKFISESEVREIEEYIDKCKELNVKPDYKYICEKYDISMTVFYKIENHTHRYSTIKEI